MSIIVIDKIIKAVKDNSFSCKEIWCSKDIYVKISRLLVEGMYRGYFIYTRDDMPKDYAFTGAIYFHE
jgi:hypothetical protein